MAEILKIPSVCCFPGLAPQWRFAFSSTNVVSRFFFCCFIFLFFGFFLCCFFMVFFYFFFLFVVFLVWLLSGDLLYFQPFSFSFFFIVFF